MSTITPEAPVSAPQPSEGEKPSTPNVKKSRFGLGARIGAGAAGLALAAGVIGVGYNVMNQPAPSEPVPTESGEAPVDGGENIPSNGDGGVSPETLSVENLRIPAGLGAEELGDVLVNDRFDPWIMAGATRANQVEYVATGGSYDYLTSLADETGDKFADALLVTNWRDIPELVAWVDQRKSINVNSMENWFKTVDLLNPEDEEPFIRSTSINGTSEFSEDRTQLIIPAIENSNADKNSTGVKDPASLEIDGITFSFVITMNGDKISNVSFQ